LNGVICRPALDDFLAEFDLPANPAKIRVTYAITGHYDVDTVDRDAALDNAQDLRPSLAGIDAPPTLAHAHIDSHIHVQEGDPS
jgi:hypothetical protein